MREKTVLRNGFLSVGRSNSEIIKQWKY